MSRLRHVVRKEGPRASSRCARVCDDTCKIGPNRSECQGVCDNRDAIAEFQGDDLFHVLRDRVKVKPADHF